MIKNGESGLAIAELEKLLSKYPDHPELLLMKATAFLDMGSEDLALPLLERLLKRGYDKEPLIYSTLGDLYKKRQRHQEAFNVFSHFLTLTDKQSRAYARTLIILDELQFILKALANPDPVRLTPLPFPINTGDSEYLPQFTIDGSSIVFTRRLNNQEDLFEVLFNDGEVQVRAIEIINTPFNEGAHTLSADGSLIIFTHCNEKIGYGGCDLYMCEKGPSGWSAPKNMGGRINTRSWESQPSLSADGQTLYFASNRKGGIGGRDLWLSRKTDGRWSAPENLSVLNTRGNDESPFIHADNTTLFFRSDQLPGMGSFDIYRSIKKEDGWGLPQHLGSPINTTGNDGALVVSLDGSKGYLATDMYEDKNLGSLDIMEFELPLKYRPRPMTFMKGRVTDGISGFPLQASIKAVDLTTGAVVASALANFNGGFLMAIPVKEKLLINVKMNGYIFYSDHVKYDSVRHQVAPFIKDIVLNPLPPEPSTGDTLSSKPVVLNNIFFESGEAILLPESEVELLFLYELMVENPTYSMVVSGHTDNVGSESDNLVLSFARAEAVRNALIRLGAEPHRIRAIGYGESKPVEDNSTPEGRAKNRRTTFEIIR